MTFGIVAAIVIAALAALHVYWALGGRWPGRNDTDLARRVIGTTRFPSPVACLAVAAALLAAGGSVLLASVGAGGQLVRAFAWATFAVFLLRGVGGFLDGKVRPSIRHHPYHRANLLLYSPLCLVIAGLVAAARLSG